MRLQADIWLVPDSALLETIAEWHKASSWPVCERSDSSKVTASSSADKPHLEVAQRSLLLRTGDVPYPSEDYAPRAGHDRLSLRRWLIFLRESDHRGDLRHLQDGEHTQFKQHRFISLSEVAPPHDTMTIEHRSHRGWHIVTCEVDSNHGIIKLALPIRRFISQLAAVNFMKRAVLRELQRQIVGPPGQI